MARRVAVCGTLGGMSKHRREGTTPCDDCREAEYLYNRDHRDRAKPRPPQPRMPDFTGGLCRQTDPDLFFVDKGGSVRPGKRVCGACDIQNECLTYALKFDFDGTWGGLSRGERRKIQRAQGVEPLPHMWNGDAA